MILFYLVFKLRLSLAKLDSNLTEIARKIALDKVNKLDDENTKENKDQ
jgi:hypothetical protein